MLQIFHAFPASHFARVCLKKTLLFGVVENEVHCYYHVLLLSMSLDVNWENIKDCSYNHYVIRKNLLWPLIDVLQFDLICIISFSRSQFLSSKLQD